MTTYNTGNPIGSTDARDLYDNAQNLDTAVNTSNPVWVDRFGVARQSLASAAGFVIDTPWLNDSDFATLAEADAAAAAANKQLAISTVWAVATTTTLTSAIEVLPGGGFSGAGALTINGPFYAGLYQVFTGTNAVTFGAGSVPEVCPEWWGADPSGAVESAAALQSAVNTVQGSGLKLKFSGFYKVSTAINITKRVFVGGHGPGTGISNATAAGSAAFIIDGAGSAYPYANFSSFSDFSIVGDGSTSGSGIKYLDRAAYLQLTRIYLEGNNNGVWHHAPPNSGGTARATWGSSYGATFNSVYAKANYGKGFYDDSTDNPDPGAQFNSCISEQNAVGIDWGSGEVSLVGGIYQADVGGEAVFRARASLLNVYFEVAAADYAGGSVVDIYGYGSSIQGCTFNTNNTQNIKHISYRSTTVIDGNIFAASGSPAGCIGIYNASGGQAYTASKIFNNINNGTTTFQRLGTAEVFYQDTASATHLSSVITTGTVISGGKVTLGVAATGATNQVEFSGLCSAGAASNNSLFIDSATGKLSFKNAAGVTNALY